MRHLSTPDFAHGLLWRFLALFVFASFLVSQLLAHTTGLQLNKKEYFEAPGINVMAFQDIYPAGHQGGVSIIQNGVRTGTVSGKPDDRWVFTEQNPAHEYKAIAALAATSRVLKATNPALSAECKSVPISRS